MPKKKDKWFIKVRASYLPSSWQAWLLYVPFTAYLVFVLIYSIRTQGNVLEIFLLAFPQFIAAAVVMTWIASKKS